MLGKACEIKSKLIHERCEMNPAYENDRNAGRYITFPLDGEINIFLSTIGNSTIISIQYQMSAGDENITETALIIYKEESA